MKTREEVLARLADVELRIAGLNERMRTAADYRDHDACKDLDESINDQKVAAGVLRWALGG